MEQSKGSEARKALESFEKSPIGDFVFIGETPITVVRSPAPEVDDWTDNKGNHTPRQKKSRYGNISDHQGQNFVECFRGVILVRKGGLFWVVRQSVRRSMPSVLIKALWRQTAMPSYRNRWYSRAITRMKTSEFSLERSWPRERRKRDNGESGELSCKQTRARTKSSVLH